MRCSIVYSDEVATPPVITANTVWKEFETTLTARLKHVITKDKRGVDKVRTGDTSQTHADQAMTKMRAEAAEAKVVLIEWSTPKSISPDTQEAERVLFSGPCIQHLPKDRQICPLMEHTTTRERVFFLARVNNTS